MSRSKATDGSQARLDELRRVLYRPGATEDDLRRYTEERSAAQPVEGAPEAPPEPRTRRPARRALLVASGIVAAAVLASSAGVGAGVLAADGRPSAAPRATADRSGTTTGTTFVLQDIGDGQTQPQSDSGESTATTVPIEIDGRAVVAQRFQGVGDAVVPVGDPLAPIDGGRAVVLLTSAESSPIAWRALRSVRRTDSTFFEQVVARGTVASRAAVPTSSPFSYVGAPPSRIAIQAPAGLLWTLYIAFPGDAESALH